MPWSAFTDAPDVRAVVITSAGSRFFSTGAMVGDYWTRYRDDMVGMRAYERALEKTFAEMIHCPKPIIHASTVIALAGQMPSSRGRHRVRWR